MDGVKSKSRGCTLALLAASIVGCTTAEEERGRPTSSRLQLADEWAAAIHDMGRFPVIPPSEDIYVGDVFAFSTAPNFGSAESARGLRTAATPRWKSLQVLSLLDSEYRERPSWNNTADELQKDTPSEQPPAVTANPESLYRSGRVPVRHRIIGIRSMANLTLEVPDLEPFIPIEIAPLIQGPATPARLGVSVQAGEAEAYSLSVDTMLGQLIEADPNTPAKFRLRSEHLGNLPLVANQTSGLAYLAVITEVVYVRSIEATVRRRAPKPTATNAEGDSAERPPEYGPEPPPTKQADVGTEAIQRAASMNEALAASGIEDRIAGNIKIVMATDNAITLRRRWPYPLAVAIRGITLEIAVTNGNVVRMGPLGTDLPELPPPPKPESPPRSTSGS